MIRLHQARIMKKSGLPKPENQQNQSNFVSVRIPKGLQSGLLQLQGNYLHTDAGTQNRHLLHKPY